MASGLERATCVAGVLIVTAARRPSRAGAVRCDPAVWDVARAYLDRFGAAASCRARSELAALGRCGLSGEASLRRQLVGLIEWLWVRLPANDL